jgi:uncharacterized membrane protein YcgQ (UPF0703/DUF1980 family)
LGGCLLPVLEIFFEVIRKNRLAWAIFRFVWLCCHFDYVLLLNTPSRSWLQRNSWVWVFELIQTFFLQEGYWNLQKKLTLRVSDES